MNPTGDILQDLPPSANYHPLVRIGAKVISYIFHPLFIPVYVAFFLVYEVRFFPDKTDWQHKLIIIQFFVSYTLFPMVATLLCKGLGFIDSIHLRSQRDRIIPYVICEIFYFWAWYVFKSNHFPKEVVMFGLAIFLSCSFGLILNIYLKVSMHTLALGVLTTFLFLSGTMTDMNYGPYISLTLLVAGITSTARLIDSDHTSAEVYTGLFAGALCQLVAYLFA